MKNILKAALLTGLLLNFTGCLEHKESKYKKTSVATKACSPEATQDALWVNQQFIDMVNVQNSASNEEEKLQFMENGNNVCTVVLYRYNPSEYPCELKSDSYVGTVDLNFIPKTCNKIIEQIKDMKSKAAEDNQAKSPEDSSPSCDSWLADDFKHLLNKMQLYQEAKLKNDGTDTIILRHGLRACDYIFKNYEVSQFGCVVDVDGSPVQAKYSSVVQACSYFENEKLTETNN